jgi:hypothetical protein
MTVPAAFPKVHVEITTPGDLVAVLGAVRRCLEDGSLRQIMLPNGPLAQMNLMDIPVTGPWPDFIEAHLTTAHGAKFALTAETFHGTGGSWAPVDDEVET